MDNLEREVLVGEIRSDLLETRRHLDELKNNILILTSEEFWRTSVEWKLDARTKPFYTGEKDRVVYYATHAALDNKPEPKNPYIPLEERMGRHWTTIALMELTKNVDVFFAPRSDGVVPTNTEVSFMFTKAFARYVLKSLPETFVLYAPWPLIRHIIDMVQALESRLQNQKHVFQSSQQAIDTLSTIFKEIPNQVLKMDRATFFADIGDPDQIDSLILLTEPSLNLCSMPDWTFLTEAAYVNESFLRILEKYFFRILKIDGDGNCFYRAVIKNLFPNVPKEIENQLSHSLRLKINDDVKEVPMGNPSQVEISKKRKDQEKKESEFVEISLSDGKQEIEEFVAPVPVQVESVVQVEDTIQLESVKSDAATDVVEGKMMIDKGFIEDNVNDAETMKRDGVWADHIQITKLMLVFKLKLIIVRYDDANLQLNLPERKVTVGRDFQLEAGSQGNDASSSEDMPTILLYYNPTPGHYETILPKDYSLPVFENEYHRFEEVCTKVTDNQWTNDSERFTIHPLDICRVLFALEEETMSLKDLHSTLWDCPYELKETITTEAQHRFAQCKQCLDLIKTLIHRLGYHTYFDEYYSPRNASRSAIDDVLQPFMTWILCDKEFFDPKPYSWSKKGSLSNLNDRLEGLFNFKPSKYRYF
eukprot:TRINITY_DN3588_c0_g1_i1.p1 TRINITY_DN3588_c0_g1~~TRINITY_DN3588_c0_g1_i1.p1  ORF type:complete len:741 (-),score=228.72 TRINITY_DN3588_c0_g1_i1:756-2696(-)